MTIPTNEPTLGEVARTLSRIERDLGKRLDEITARLDRVITIELYEAHQLSVRQRFESVEAEVEELHRLRAKDEERRAADRRIVVGALLSAALAVVVAVVTTMLKVQGA